MVMILLKKWGESIKNLFALSGGVVVAYEIYADATKPLDMSSGLVGKSFKQTTDGETTRFSYGLQVGAVLMPH